MSSHSPSKRPRIPLSIHCIYFFFTISDSWTVQSRRIVGCYFAYPLHSKLGALSECSRQVISPGIIYLITLAAQDALSTPDYPCDNVFETSDIPIISSILLCNQPASILSALHLHSTHLMVRYVEIHFNYTRNRVSDFSVA